MQKDFNDGYSEHIPVLLDEVLDYLQVRPGKQYIDATFGFGGHSQAIIKKGGTVLGIERDEQTIREAKKQLHISKQEQKRLTIVHGSYEHIDAIAVREGFGTVHGILFDLGYSSWQLDKSGRGFRFTGNEPLDMRYEPNLQHRTAAEVINRNSREALTELIMTYAEEEQARRVADALVKNRPITTNTHLVSVLELVFGVHQRRNIARVFQAMRIAVNNELQVLTTALPKARSLLDVGGRLAVITFHSLEDRVVKRYMVRTESVEFSIVTKKPVTASYAETVRNSRAKSAKLRVAQKI